MAWALLALLRLSIWGRLFIGLSILSDTGAILLVRYQNIAVITGSSNYDTVTWISIVKKWLLRCSFLLITMSASIISHNARLFWDIAEVMGLVAAHLETATWVINCLELVLSGLVWVILIWWLIVNKFVFFLLNSICIVFLIKWNICVNGRYFLWDIVDVFWRSLIRNWFRSLVNELQILF